MKIDEARTLDRGSPELSKLIFFDTNVVQNLHSCGEFIYDSFLDPVMDAQMSARGSRFRDDMFALADFMALGRRNGWPIAVSPGILEELGAIRQPGKRLALTVWANELAHYCAQLRESRDAAEASCYGEVERFTVAQRCWLSDRLAILPQESDRQLVIDALEHGCDVFLTMDYKTIWRYRDELDRFGLRVMRPVELLEHVDPQAGLLR
ncbi:MAG: hypothetical protein F4Z00_13645 [Acidimicrobiaceae bacterium]|nr:hypothetical protein [Acidimicrobiaceae bacterium]MXZ66567.1 hypothetical protein [Acidimicrobiaceae bacterium]MYF34753.1 hypothetical protein [Acidimicrobiaceae bacterium]MYG79458.1 hypothetical protein [Acidimicrobiaceae bacterium]MYJ30164.1 hypothetical protein [Acidimicrobiaceae bacterium]